MDFFKSVLPPLPKLPKLKKIRQWNGGSLLSLNQFPHLPAAFNLGSGGVAAATTTVPSAHPPEPAPRGGQVRRPQQHMRHSSDISIISAAVSSRPPADFGRRDNLGLYALKCDRSAAKRGILLNLPRKITQATGAAGAAMVHEKFSPCKRPEPAAIRPPPRRRKRPPPATSGQQVLGAPAEEVGRWQKNSSELFRIVERESASAARARSAGGIGLHRAKKPPPDDPTDNGNAGGLGAQVKAHSVDNLLAMRYHRRRRGAFAEPEVRREDSENDSDRQVHSLRLHEPPPRAPSPARKPTQHDQPPARSGSKPATNKPVVVATIQPSDGAPAVGRAFPLDKARDFSIENNSDEIEVRFRKGYSTDESSETAVTVTKRERLPLPPRVVQLRRHDSGQKAVRTKPPKEEESNGAHGDPGVEANGPTRFLPLAEVLRKSIDSAELKRKWLNDFLAQGNDESGEGERPPEQATRTRYAEPFVPQMDIIQRMDRQLEELEAGRAQEVQLSPQDAPSADSVDIFRRTTCDFEEFDELFEEPGTKKTVTLNEQVTYIDRNSNLCFSSSSFSCTSVDDGMKPSPSTDVPSVPPPPPPPPPPPLPATMPPSSQGKGQRSNAQQRRSGGPTRTEKIHRSTVNIQDYSSKHLQRVRYLSSPSPSRSSTAEPATCQRPARVGNGSVSENERNDDDEHEHGREKHRKANNNIVLPLNVFNIASSYDRDDGISSSGTQQRHGWDGSLDANHLYHQLHSLLGEPNQNLTPEAAPSTVSVTVRSVDAAPISRIDLIPQHRLDINSNRNIAVAPTFGQNLVDGGSLPSRDRFGDHSLPPATTHRLLQHQQQPLFFSMERGRCHELPPAAATVPAGSVIHTYIPEYYNEEGVIII